MCPVHIEGWGWRYSSLSLKCSRATSTHVSGFSGILEIDCSGTFNCFIAGIFKFMSFADVQTPQGYAAVCLRECRDG